MKIHLQIETALKFDFKVIHVIDISVIESQKYIKGYVFTSVLSSRLNSLVILHPCAKTNEPKNIHTKIAIMRSLEAAQFIG